MGGHINCYVDVVSPYSYVAFIHLRRNKELLHSHGVQVEFVPVFLGAIMHGSKNQPPWMTPAKAQLGRYDVDRSKVYFDVPNLRRPDRFPIPSLLPMRCMVHVKRQLGEEKLELALHGLWQALWERNEDISQPEVLESVLRNVFTSAETEDMVAAASKPEVKQRLQDNTDEALKRGAYGAPWFWVCNDGGAEEPFFGSDRFHHMWMFLDIPFTDITIQPVEKTSRI